VNAGEALELPLVKLGQALLNKQVTSRALVEESLRRLEEVGRPLNAVAALLPERARVEAARADKELAAGKWRGPLHGVPYGAKDLFAARGAPTTWGAPFYARRVLDHDAGAIEKLSAAGAVLVAKLSMVQLAGGFGYYRADASLQGPGRNPWDRERWAGGSSSGSGAAVAARCVPFALGSETWGSILTPSAFCGVVGLRPTFGRVTRRGAMALSWSMDKIGPLCTRAEDAAIVLDTLAGHDPRDPGAVENQPPFKPGRPLGGRKLRIGAVLPEALGKQDPEVFAAHQAVLEALGKLAQVEAVPLPAPEIPSDGIALLTVNVEEAAAFEELIDSGELASLRSTDAVAAARADRAIPASEYLKAQRLRAKLRAAYEEMFDKLDAVVTPALGFLAATPPGIDDDLEAALAGDDPLGSAGNLLGLPAIALPGPLVRGLPTGMQLLGPAWSEELLCAAAAALEETTGWAQQRPRREG
jgi:aspartyl-tRNA(Asn)/glutamyl-tRNA(Gln) amidotransferase subunit A